VGAAINSGDTDQIQQAREVLDIFSNLPRDARESLNNSNTVNTLGNSNGIGELLLALRAIVENTRETASNTGETRIVEVP
jgi:hypothetical protein